MYEIPEIDFAVQELREANSALIDVYLEIHEALLPQYARYAPAMRRRAEKAPDASAVEQWHQWLLMIRNQPVGMIEFLYNRKRNTGILLDFAIQPEARHVKHGQYQRLAGLVLQFAILRLMKDAQANGCSAPLGMIAEVEHAHLVEKYKEYGFVEFPIEYLEPPATPELMNVTPAAQNFDKIGYKKMYLGVFQIPGHPIDSRSPEILKTILLTLWEDHYCLPADHWLLQKMF
jgi:hypothetical protein